MSVEVDVLKEMLRKQHNVVLARETCEAIVGCIEYIKAQDNTRRKLREMRDAQLSSHREAMHHIDQDFQIFYNSCLHVYVPQNQDNVYVCALCGACR